MSETLKTRHDDIVAFDRRGSGPAVVFVSGAGPYRATDPIMGGTAELAAAQGLTTIVYDRLGRGESKAAGRIGPGRVLINRFCSSVFAQCPLRSDSDRIAASPRSDAMARCGISALYPIQPVASALAHTGKPSSRHPGHRR
jgi:hypothetical protein